MSQFIHYSKHPNLTELHGSMSGTGIRGSEDARVAATSDPRIKKRIYFYVPTPTGLPRPEEGLGHFVYSAELSNLLDSREPSEAANKVAMRKNIYIGQGENPDNAYERAVLDAGYDGYRTDNLAVVLNKSVPVIYQGTTVGKTFGTHVFNTKEKSRSIFAGVPNKDGEYSSSSLTPEQVMFWMKNKSSLVRAAPSVRMEYGRLYVHQSEIANLKSVLNDFPENPLS